MVFCYLQVKKGLEHLCKKVEKHLCEEENLFQVSPCRTTPLGFVNPGLNVFFPHLCIIYTHTVKPAKKATSDDRPPILTGHFLYAKGAAFQDRLPCNWIGCNNNGI